MPLGLYGVNWHLDRVYGSGTPATLYVAVMFSEPNYLSTGSDLDEPTGGGYARSATTNSDAYWGAAADGLKSNSQDIVFPTATATWGTLRYWAICDAATDGEMLSWGTMSQALILEGGTLRFERDQLAITAR
jgi:hypothetical protein